MKKFVLKRKINRFRQGDSDRPKICIRPETYSILCDWSTETGLSMAELAAKVVNYAASNLVWDDEEEV